MPFSITVEMLISIKKFYKKAQMTNKKIANIKNISWQYPEFEIREYFSRRTKYCICVFVLNERNRLQSQLQKMASISELADIILADGGSSDGCVDEDLTKQYGVRAVLTKRGPGKLGAQMRMAFAYAINQGYEGVITVDGNDKDDVVAGLPGFIKNLDEGFDHIQGSRFIAGGKHKNTPLLRLLGVRLLHAPLLSFASGFDYSDTTNGFRAYSRKFLTDERIINEGSTKSNYDLHYYLAMNGLRNGFQAIETPVSRSYLMQGKAPTKIVGVRANLSVLLTLFREALRPGLQIVAYVKLSIITLLLVFTIQCYRLILKHTDFSLHDFSGRIVGTTVLHGIDASKRTPFLLLGYFVLASAILFSLFINDRLRIKVQERPFYLHEPLTVMGLTSGLLALSSLFVASTWGGEHYVWALSLGAGMCFTILMVFTMFPYSKISRSAPNQGNLLLASGAALGLLAVVKLQIYRVFSVSPLDGILLPAFAILGAYLLSIVQKHRVKLYHYFLYLFLFLCAQFVIYMTGSGIRRLLPLRNRFYSGRTLVMLFQEFMIVLAAIFLAYFLNSRLPKKGQEVPAYLHEPLEVFCLSTFLLAVSSFFVAGIPGWEHYVGALSLGAGICFSLFMTFIMFPYSRISRAAPSKQNLLFASGAALGLLAAIKLQIHHVFSMSRLDGILLPVLSICGAYLLSIVQNSRKNLYQYLLYVFLFLSAQFIIYITGNEIQYLFTLRERFYPNRILVILLQSIAIVSITAYALMTRLVSAHNSGTLRIEKIFRVLISITLGILSSHELFVTFDYADLFHSSESLLPSLELARFHKLPWLDILPTHGFSDRPFSYLHALSSGVKGLEIIAWDWLFPTLLFSITYYLLSNLMGFVAAAIILFLCTGFTITSGDVREGYLAMGWLLLSLGLWSNRLFIRLISQVALCSTFFFYPAVGVPIMVAGTGSIFIWTLIFEKRLVKAFIRALLPIFVVSIIFTLAALFRTGGFDPIIQVIEFIKMQGQSMSYETFLNDNLKYIVLMYQIQPLSFIVLAVLSCWCLMRSEKMTKHSKIYLFVFFTSVVFALNFNRFIQRHSLFERFNIDGLWSALPLSLLLVYTKTTESLSLSVIPISSRKRKIKWMMAIITLGLFVTIYRESVPRQLHAAKTAWQIGSKRVQNVWREPTEVITFLKNKLKPNQTFYDLSNSPSLYVASGAQFPTFIIPSLFHTSQKTQEKVVKDLEILRKKGDLPIIVYKRGDNSWSDSVDGVPNVVRSFLVSSFIHRSYVPCATVWNYGIWCEKIKPEFAKVLYQGELSLLKLPEIWGMYDRAEYKEVSTVTGTRADQLWALQIPDEREGLVIRIDGCSQQGATAMIQGKTVNHELFSMFSFPLKSCHESPIRNTRNVTSIASGITIHRVWVGMSSIAYAADLKEILVSFKNRAFIENVTLEREISP